MEVSGNRPATKDRYPKIKASETAPVGLAVISQTEVGLISCNCGWRFIHVRNKVREERADTHVGKKHGGQAAWM